MKGLAVVAVVMGLLAVPSFGQHAGAGHAGFAGHAAPVGHSGFSAAAGGHFAAPARPSAPVRYGTPRFASPGQFRSNPMVYRGSGAAAPRYGYTGQRTGSQYGNAGSNRNGGNRDNHRRPYVSAWRTSYVYPYAPIIWPGYPTVLDYDDYDDSGYAQDAGPMNYGDNGADTSQAYGPDNGQAYAGPDNGPYPQYGAPAPYGNGQYLGAWPATPAGSSAQAQSGPSPESAVTLVFLDGHSVEIHNYVLTQSSIFVGDGRGITIPLSQLDLSATEKANSDAGVDFHLPRSQD